MTTIFLPRSAWTNHGPVRPLTAMSAGPLRGFAIHWPGNGVSHIDATDQSRIAAEIEGERKYHTRPGGLGVKQGGNDIAYQYAIDMLGRVWELRGVTHQSGANGDTTSNKAYGAVTLLLGSDDVPSAAMIQAVRDFRQKIWLAHFPKATKVVGHRDVYSTDCPGPRAYALVKNGTFLVPPVKPPVTRPTLRRGSMGALVKLVQKAVGVAQDGVFGPITEAHVKRFQATHKLVPDGVVGPATWKVIDAVLKAA